MGIPQMTNAHLLKERSRILILGNIYKVLRVRPNGKATIKYEGPYVPSRSEQLAKDLEEVQEKLKLLEEEKKEEEDAKNN